MSNVQLYLAVGVPFFSLLVVWLSNSRSMDRGFAGIRLQLEGMNSRLDRIEGRMDRLETRVDAIGSDLREFYATQRQHDTRLDNLERRQAS